MYYICMYVSMNVSISVFVSKQGCGRLTLPYTVKRGNLPFQYLAFTGCIVLWAIAQRDHHDAVTSRTTTTTSIWQIQGDHRAPSYCSGRQW